MKIIHKCLNNILHSSNFSSTHEREKERERENNTNSNISYYKALKN